MIPDVISCYTPFVPIQTTVAEIPVLSTITNVKAVVNKCVGLPYRWAELYTGRVACCSWCVTVSMPPGETNGRTDRQTDGHRTVTLCFLLEAASVITLAIS